eukprot:CAMPEP_0206255918 /NCGR_PEP_ID=MMETSP0047_2-20121206/24495_1 /ASSEMBLY_ACC=CAM_ASM_000192 /TAXON_ID=195065 /ORGANISM="Chroomonas mesostigmatica_cf, Strain CCMP1168" /LENGTH=153 /DNA_ID=CAMNT_0053682333 /DNA_START=423 /DNA_END=880 /DNA_ORIENTATION=+
MSSEAQHKAHLPAVPAAVVVDHDPVVSRLAVHVEHTREVDRSLADEIIFADVVIKNLQVDHAIALLDVEGLPVAPLGGLATALVRLCAEFLSLLVVGAHDPHEHIRVRLGEEVSVLEVLTLHDRHLELPRRHLFQRMSTPTGRKWSRKWRAVA